MDQTGDTGAYHKKDQPFFVSREIECNLLRSLYLIIIYKNKQSRILNVFNATLSKRSWECNVMLNRKLLLGNCTIQRINILFNIIKLIVRIRNAAFKREAH